MQYRRFGRLDWRVSALGFGAMRLPHAEGDPGNIDEPRATGMLRYAIDHGVNYVDTAYGYHRSQSEVLVGRALADGYRERVKVATKLPCWLVEKADDFDRLLDEQTERLQGKPNFYLLHALGAESWAKVRDLGVLDWAEAALAAGRFDHLGFSFHDTVDAFKTIVDAYDNWTLAQIQYNYMDENHQAGRAGLQYAASKGLALVIMEPLRGGLLANEPPDAVKAIWATAAVQRTPAEWALQWVWDQPAVSLALSGMSTMEQVEQNIEYASRSAVESMTADELDIVTRVGAGYKALSPIPCTACNYCQPCPNGVAIPRIFELYNEAAMYNAPDRSRFVYTHWVREEERANCCLECGECEEKCPQGIEIIEWLQKADKMLLGNNG
jgi:uncharacterized protein